MSKYKVSVIVPVYNIEMCIEKCIKSIIDQTNFNDIELIIINDGSTDSSFAKCLSYSEKYENISVITKKNSGVSSARNYGIDKANGEYILFVDGDDFIEKTYIETLLNATDNGKYDMIIADYWIYFSDNNKKKYRNKNKSKKWNSQDAIRELLSGGLIGNNLFDKLFKTSNIKGIRFNTNIKIGEDLLFVYEYLKNIDKINGIFYPGYYYVQRDGSAMNSNFSKKQFDILNVSQIIERDIYINNVSLCNQAIAFSIHCKYKLVERAYKSNDYSEYRNEIEQLENDIKKYKIIDGYKYLSKRQFCGLLLIRFFPALYLLACKIKKI